MELMTALSLCWLRGQLLVCYSSKVLGVVNLVQRQTPVNLVIGMTDSTICEIVPDNLKTAKNLLNLLEDPKYHFLFTSDLKIVYMFRHEDLELTVLMQHAQFGVDRTRYHAALL